jgi:hypothetical protein
VLAVTEDLAHQCEEAQLHKLDWLLRAEHQWRPTAL